jgi:hypothetical protein
MIYKTSIWEILFKKVVNKLIVKVSKSESLRFISIEFLRGAESEVDKPLRKQVDNLKLN